MFGNRYCSIIGVLGLIVLGLNSAAAQDLLWQNDKIEVIPFQLKRGYPYIDIKIGEKKYNLIVDLTDYREITLATDVLENIPHTVTGSDKYIGPEKKVFHLKQFTLDQVALGGLKKQHIKGTEEVIDPNYPTSSPNGAIGAGMFFDDVLTLDFHNSQFIVNPKGKLDRCEPLAVMGLPLVTLARLEGKNLTFLIDNASQYSVIDENIAQSLSKTQPDNNKTLEILLADLHLDNFDIKNIPFYPLSMAGTGLHGVIGMDVLRRYNLAIDFKNNCYNLPLAQEKMTNPLPLRIPEFR